MAESILSRPRPVPGPRRKPATPMTTSATARARTLAGAFATLVGLALSGCAGPGSGGVAAGAGAAPVADADARRIDDEVAALFAAPHAAMPPLATPAGAASGSTAVIEVRNDTPYTLELLGSGPTSKRLRIAPKAGAALILQPGRYRMAARVVEASPLPPFAGTSDFGSARYAVAFSLRPPAPAGIDAAAAADRMPVGGGPGRRAPLPLPR